MKLKNLSLICTVFNEEETIADFIDSVGKQVVLPKELIIVDGGSSDSTVNEIKSKINQYKNKFLIKFFIKKGNRSVGRNEAIKRSTGEIILSSDSGNILDKNWIKNIIKPFSDKTIGVVAGYYKGEAKTIFQKSLVPYVLVMPDRVDANSFLPATRSMAFKKSAWKDLGGFDEKLSHNEDFAFANKLKEKHIKIKFVKNAIVKWIPRQNLAQAFKMFFRFALGDVEANIFRDKVILLFLRYFFAVYLIILNFLENSYLLVTSTLLLFFIYVVWAIYKNYKYVNNFSAIIYLPIIQITSDVAVILGSVLGIINKFTLRNLINTILKNKLVFILLLGFTLTLLSIINWGLPNNNHPFSYFMDEWHQSQAVRAVFTQGTPNLFGAANGSMFHFFLSGIFLIPFYLFNVIDPFAIKSSVSNLSSQHSLFEVFRLNTLFFGLLSGILISYIAKKYFKLNGFVVAFLLLINPVFLMLSNYFKYDIALVFWIIVALWATLEYVSTPTLVKNIIASIFLAVTISVKLSTPTLFVAFLLIITLINSGLEKKLKFIFVSIFVYLFTFIFLGIPDAIFGRSNPIFYITENLTTIPASTENLFNLGGLLWWQYLPLNLYPSTFGKVFYFSFFISFSYFSYTFVKNIFKFKKFVVANKNITVVFFYLLFLGVSLIPLNIAASNNRILVLFPFMSIITVYGFNLLRERLKSHYFKNLFILIIFIGLMFQFAETYSWMSVKLEKNIRETSSEWILKNINKYSNIGIENIPVYQYLPDIIIKDFYLKQHDSNYSNLYKIEIINSKSVSFPKYVILTNDFEEKFVINSEKGKIVRELIKRNYIKTKEFKVDLTYFKKFNKNDREYFMSGLSTSHMSISIYEKI